jgi:hypothetical protein
MHLSIYFLSFNDSCAILVVSSQSFASNGTNQDDQARDVKTHITPKCVWLGQYAKYSVACATPEQYQAENHLIPMTLGGQGIGDVSILFMRLPALFPSSGPSQQHQGTRGLYFYHQLHRKHVGTGTGTRTRTMLATTISSTKEALLLPSDLL